MASFFMSVTSGLRHFKNTLTLSLPKRRLGLGVIPIVFLGRFFSGAILMRSISLRLTLLTLVLAISSVSLADQKIKTKSNIKNDRVAASSSAACADEKEGSADGKTPCKTLDTKSSASSVASKDVEGVEDAKSQ